MGIMTKAVMWDRMQEVARANGFEGCTDAIVRAQKAEANVALLLSAIQALQIQALQSPDLIDTEWGQEALDQARAAIARATSPDAPRAVDKQEGVDADPS